MITEPEKLSPFSRLGKISLIDDTRSPIGVTIPSWEYFLLYVYWLSPPLPQPPEHHCHTSTVNIVQNNKIIIYLINKSVTMVFIKQPLAKPVGMLNTTLLHFQLAMYHRIPLY